MVALCDPNSLKMAAHQPVGEVTVGWDSVPTLLLVLQLLLFLLVVT